MTGPRRLWLVRHGETEGQSSIRYHGSTDVPLSELGRDQIRALVPLLAGIDSGLVVHSPLLRAAESAAILASACGVGAERLRVDRRLQEISFGACEGMTAPEIAAAFPEFWARHERGEADAFPGGESRTAFGSRVLEAVHELARPALYEDVLVVAHRGTVRFALHALLGATVPDATGPGAKGGKHTDQPGAVLQHLARNPFGVRLGSLTVLRLDLAWNLELLDFVP